MRFGHGRLCDLCITVPHFICFRPPNALALLGGDALVGLDSRATFSAEYAQRWGTVQLYRWSAFIVLLSLARLRASSGLLAVYMARRNRRAHDDVVSRGGLARSG